jgi:hypothetical protein
MDIGSIGINALDIAAIEGGPSSVANAIINTDKQTLHARSISPTRREQYRKEGRCVRCGSYDHWVGSCTFQPARRQTAVRIIRDLTDDAEWDSELERRPAFSRTS